MQDRAIPGLLPPAPEILPEWMSVKGADQSPLFQYLSQEAGEPPWNFTKDLVGRDGKVIRRFDSAVDPESPELKAAIEAALK